MTEKKIFVYKPFLALNILAFSLLFKQKLHFPLKKVTPICPSNRPLKIEILSILNFFKNLIGCSNPQMKSHPLFEKILNTEPASHS